MKRITIILIYLLSAVLVFTQEVQRSELLRVQGESIEFTRYVGPHAVIQSREQIRSIGLYLGARTAEGESQAVYFQKYRIQRYIEEAQGFNGDILSLTEGAEVDDIVNLRRILSGYFEAAYQYNREDADLLAEIVTIYNAVYRGNVAFFQENYVPSLADDLSPEKAGLSTFWDEWAGKSQIVIPLRNSFARGDNNQVDTDSLTTNEVIEEVGDSPQGLETRKDVTELKEEEIQEEKAAIEEKEEEIRQREETLEREEETMPPEDVQREKDAIVEEKAAVEEAKEEVARREESLAEERSEIARDEQNQINQQNQETIQPAVTAAPVKPVFFLQVEDQGSTPYGQLIVIDANTGKAVKTSELNSIRGRKFEFYGSHLLVVAGREDRGGDVKLLLLDKEEMTITRESEVSVFGETLLLQNGGELYAVIKTPKGWALGLFNQQLELVAQSSEEIFPFTAMALAEGRLYVQSAAGTVLALDPKTLKE